MTFDQVLEKHVGNCGRYQKVLILLLTTAAIFSCMFTMEIIFSAGKMNHWCKVPVPLEGPLANVSHEEWLNLTIPFVEQKGHVKRDRCHMYAGNASMYVGRNESYLTSVQGNGTVSQCSSYEYDRSLFESSIVSEWDLVCDKSYLISLVKSFTIAGKGIGYLFGGVFSDRFGRKKAMVGSFLLIVLGRLVVTFSQSLPVFLSGLTFTLFGQVVMYATIFTLCMELVGPSWRAAVGALPAGQYALGYLVLAGVAYFCRDRFTLHLANTVPFLLLVPVIWIAPESPRWLLDRGRPEEATQVLRQLSKRNGKKWPSDLKLDETNIQSSPLHDSSTKDKKDEPVPVSQILKQIFTSRVLVIRVFINFFAWFTANMAYFGLTLNIQSLAGSFYVNLAIAGALELVATFLGYVLIDSRLGRRITTCTLYLISGLSLLLVLAVPEDKKIYSTALALFGRTCCSTYFMVIFLWTAEIFPTALRNTSVGLSSASGKVGGILAPFLAELGMISEVLPMIILGGLSILSGLLLLTFPETKGVELPNTVEDMLHSKKSTKVKESHISANGNYTKCQSDVTNV